MIADLVVVLIVAAFVYSGYRAGLMRAFVKIVSYAVSIVVSVLLYPVVSDILIKTPIYEKLVSIINEKYAMQNPQIDADGVFGVLSQYIDKGIKDITSGFSAVAATLIINILAFILILILSKILISLLGKTLNLFTKLPVIKQFNRLGGAILGGMLGVAALYIVSAVLIMFSPFENGGRIYQEIKASTFASEIYENNLILDFIEKGKNGE